MQFEPIQLDATPLKDRRYISIYLRADNKLRIYKREVQTIMDFLGDIGGIIEIVFTIGFLTTAAFVTRSMNAEMIKEAYHIQRYARDSTQVDIDSEHSDPSHSAPKPPGQQDDLLQNSDTVKSPEPGPFQLNSLR